MGWSEQQKNMSFLPRSHYEVAGQHEYTKFFKIILYLKQYYIQKCFLHYTTTDFKILKYNAKK